MQLTKKLAPFAVACLLPAAALATGGPQPGLTYTPSTDFEKPAYFFFQSPYRVAEGGASGTGDAGGDLWRRFNAYTIGAPSEAGVSAVMLSMRLITGDATVAVYGRPGDMSGDGILMGVLGAYGGSDNGSTYTHLELPVDDAGDFEVRVESGNLGNYRVEAVGYIGRSADGEHAASGPSGGGGPPGEPTCPRRMPNGDYRPCE